MSNHKSFTLIELLVVIAIIGVLSAIVITSISGAVTKSRIVRLQVFSDTIRAQLSDSLVSYWPLNEGIGTTTYDQWEGNNGELKNFNFDDNSGWKSGGECISGKCLKLDGVDDYVDISSIGKMDYTHTWSIIFDIIGGGENTQDIMSNNKVPASSAGETIRWENSGGDYGRLRFRLNYGDVSHTYADIIYNLPSFDIYMVVTVFDKYNEESGSYTAYVNGERIDQKLVEGRYRTWYDSVRFGNTRYYTPGGYDYPFNGIIDEVRIYNGAASITQVQSQYLAGLDKLLSNGSISKSEYNQRIKELSKEIVIE